MTNHPKITGRDITMTDLDLVILMRQVAEVAARRALMGAGLESPTLSYRQAAKQYGSETLKRWIKESVVKPIQDGMNSTKRYSVIELMTVALQSNRRTYLSVSERREKS